MAGFSALSAPTKPYPLVRLHADHHHPHVHPLLRRIHDTGTGDRLVDNSFRPKERRAPYINRLARRLDRRRDPLSALDLCHCHSAGGHPRQRHQRLSGHAHASQSPAHPPNRLQRPGRDSAAGLRARRMGDFAPPLPSTDRAAARRRRAVCPHVPPQCQI